MSKIVVVGDEDFTLGFELVGIESFPFEDFEKLIAKDSQASILIINEKDYSTLSLKLKSQVDRLLKPIVVILSEDDIKGSNLREAIIRALGVDLLKEKKN